jgi:hypothetical protein
VPSNVHARAMLDRLARKGMTPVAESAVSDVDVATDWSGYLGELETAADVVDRFSPDPSAELATRVYGRACTGPRQALVFRHGGGWLAGNIDLADRPQRVLFALWPDRMQEKPLQSLPDSPSIDPDDTVTGDCGRDPMHRLWGIFSADPRGFDRGDAANSNLPRGSA